jgi:hypothetical protein
MSRSTGQLCKDIEEIADWIGGVQGVLGHFNPKSGVPVGRWEPPPTAQPAPIASPKCLRPGRGQSSATSIGDLVLVLGMLREWTQSVATTLDCLEDTQIPPE